MKAIYFASALSAAFLLCTAANAQCSQPLNVPEFSQARTVDGAVDNTIMILCIADQNCHGGMYGSDVEAFYSVWAMGEPGCGA